MHRGFKTYYNSIYPNRTSILLCHTNLQKKATTAVAVVAMNNNNKEYARKNKFGLCLLLFII